MSRQIMYIDEVNDIDMDALGDLMERNRKLNNHEVWKVCANCGQHFDARWGWACPDCNFDNEP